MCVCVCVLYVYASFVYTHNAVHILSMYVFVSVFVVLAHVYEDSVVLFYVALLVLGQILWDTKHDV